jgi:hypothetical protein
MREGRDGAAGTISVLGVLCDAVLLRPAGHRQRQSGTRMKPDLRIAAALRAVWAD